VRVNGDLVNEADETFFVNLSNPTNATLADSQGLGTILNDDAVPALSFSDVTVNEGNSGTTNAVFTVSLSAVSGQSVTVNFATADGTASAGSDYVATNGLLTFAPGTTSQTVTVRVNGDLVNEADETFFVNLTTPTNASLADSQGLGTILNDDAVPALSISDVTVIEGDTGTSDAVFTVSLSAVSGQSLTVNFATADGTAVAGSDYVATNGLLTFAPGTTSQTVTVRVNGDLVNEADETFFVNLSNPTNATLTDSQGVGTIINNDGPPPVITSIQLQGADVFISFATVANRNYRIERTDDLVVGPWTIAVDNVPGTGNSVNVTDAGGADRSSRFYRIRLMLQSQ
jgi:hypothetical protein